MDKVIKVYKKCGETPLDCINNLKKDSEELRFLPMTYAGRLDPLAEGVLLILVGDECHKKDEYLSLPKEYEVEVLFGFATDTYDLLGKIKEVGLPKNLFEIKKEDLQKYLKNFIGEIEQSYPPYSSKTVKGKPLFEWAREGKINEIEIPKHKVDVKSIDIINWSEIKKEDLEKRVERATSIVKGDFRQKEILDLWKKELGNSKIEKFQTVTLRISCGSGFYARVLAHELGKENGAHSLALDITRTKVGNYTI